MFELVLLWKILIQEFIKVKRKSREFSLNVIFESNIVYYFHVHRYF